MAKGMIAFAAIRARIAADILNPEHRAMTPRLYAFVLAFGLLPGVAAAQAPGMPVGSYECWANGAARMLMNFTVTAPGRYTDSEGKAGRFVLDAGTGRVTFQGGLLDGAMPDGFVAVYHAPGGKPTVSFRSPRGAEAAFCERV